jgi:hypothetical protein
MTVELFNNGKMIADKTIMTPKGTLAMTFDLKTVQTLTVTPVVTR